MKISRLVVNGLASGCVTDEPPTISFALDSDVPGEALESALVRIGEWERTVTTQVGIVYDGPMLAHTGYDVEIIATGVTGAVARAETSFRTGRLGTEWSAKWITDAGYSFPDKSSPAPMRFRRRVRVGDHVAAAWIESTALGIYELSINGQRVSDDYFAPGLTSYEHQIQYQTYDVTHLVDGDLTLEATVGGGWAVGSFTYHRVSKISADRQALLAELHLVYRDGRHEVVTSDTDWEVATEGPYRMAEWYDGETYDATVDETSITWRPASVTAPRKDPAVVAQYGSPVRAQQELAPIAVSTAPSGEVIYDFGQNFAGVIHARITGAHGQQVVFRHAEVLVDDELFVASLRTAKATATYTCVDGPQRYSPRFTYMGFRYVGVTGVDPDDLELTALVLHTDLPETGSFECSDPMINRLNEAIRWGGKSNFVDIPTDCPQRDERQGWTGDIAVFASTAAFNFDTSRFLDKWLRDVSAEQAWGGGIPMVVPKQGDKWPTLATACWGDSCVLVPWAEYLARGDLGLLERQYSTMQRFLRGALGWAGLFSVRKSRRRVWRFPFHFGDWAAPTGTVTQWTGKGKWIATAYLANSLGIVAQIADLIDKPDDAAHYRALRAEVVSAYRKVFTDGSGTLKKEFQTAYVLPLHFGMTDGVEGETMAANLARLIDANGGHLATGFPGTPYILFALSDHGRLDDAYRLLLQDEAPSWLYMVKSGGTTVWERWDALRPDGTVNISDLSGKKSDEESSGGMVSFNHYAAGAVGDWFYRRIAGLEATAGGYREFTVAPLPGGGLTWARASVETPYGTAASDWTIDDGTFSLSVTVPVSTTANVRLPDGTSHSVRSGQHSFSCRA